LQRERERERDEQAYQKLATLAYARAYANNKFLKNYLLILFFIKSLPGALSLKVPGGGISAPFRVRPFSHAQKAYFSLFFIYLFMLN
jgi:hypothetical protein